MFLNIFKFLGKFNFDPFNIKFFSDKHRQGGTQALADFRLIVADNDIAVFEDIDKVSDAGFAAGTQPRVSQWQDRQSQQK